MPLAQLSTLTRSNPRPAPEQTAGVAIVHDYLTQRGGAERVVLSLAATFPGAPIYTSLYEPSAAFPGFQAADVRVSVLNRAPALRRDHRLALPFLAPAFSRRVVDATVTVCSSSGWAHGIRTTGRKVVYCHTPARWLYQPAVYLSGRRGGPRAALEVLGPALRRWDRRAAATADRYVVNSNEVRRRVAGLYGLDADVVPPPVTFGPDGPTEAVPGIDAGFFLCVSRLLPYKNVDAVIDAFASLPDQRLVVAGTGPAGHTLAARLPRNVTLLGEVDDARLRWLYSSCQGLISASYEDFGLTPVEAASFGKPVAVLRWGGFLDTTEEGGTGIFFDYPDPALITRSVRELLATGWDDQALRAHAARYSPERFITRIRKIVDEESTLAGQPASTGDGDDLPPVPHAASRKAVFREWKTAHVTSPDGRPAQPCQ